MIGSFNLRVPLLLQGRVKARRVAPDAKLRGREGGTWVPPPGRSAKNLTDYYRYFRNYFIDFYILIWTLSNL